MHSQKSLVVCTVALVSLLASCVKDKSKISLQEGVSANPVQTSSASSAAPENTEATRGNSEPAQSATSSTSVEVSVASSQSSALSVLKVSGSVVSTRIGSASFKIGGHIRNMYFKVGDFVKQGQVLATLDDSDFVLREKLAAAQLQQAKLLLEQAKRDLQREQQLKKENVSTDVAIEKLTTAYQNAQISLEMSVLNQKTAEKALKDTVLLAPYSGVITKRMKVEGEFVGGGAPVYEIAEVGQVELSLKFPENLITKVKLNDIIDVYFPATQIKAKAKIVRIVPVIFEANRTFEAIAVLVNPDSRVLAGQFVEAEIKL